MRPVREVEPEDVDAGEEERLDLVLRAGGRPKGGDLVFDVWIRCLDPRMKDPNSIEDIEAYEYCIREAQTDSSTILLLIIVQSRGEKGIK